MGNPHPARSTACGKYAYGDKRAAQSAANHRMHDHRSKRGKVKQLRAYCCADCGQWHLSHNRDSTAPAARAQRRHPHGWKPRNPISTEPTVYE
jgi:hypothetical protein